MNRWTIYRTTVVEDRDGREVGGFIDGPDGFTSRITERADSVAIEALLAAASQCGAVRKQARNLHVKPTELDRERAIRILRRRGLEVR